MREEAIRWTKHGPVALIHINRPEKRNAISKGVIDGLHSAFDELGADPEVKVIMTTGAGDIAWSAGFDLNYLREMLVSREETQRCPDLYFKIRNSPKVTIAVVNGYCLGGALSIMVAHDLAIASDRAKFGLPEIYRAGVPRYALAAVLSCVPKVYGLEMTLTGLNWDAHKAERAGLVNQVVAHEQLMEKAMELANHIARWDSLALTYNKRAAYQILDQLTYEQRVAVNELVDLKYNSVAGRGFLGGVEEMLEGKGEKALQ